MTFFRPIALGLLIAALFALPDARAADACPTSEFVVYFDWDRSTLNGAARETIDEAIGRTGECEIESVVVVGHTDTSGSVQYNAGLSERRASMVREALVGLLPEGVTVQTLARGEIDLARATMDGSRDPLNRRTSVTINFAHYVDARVVSQTATAFHVIRGDLWTRLGATDQARLDALIVAPEFGPYRIGDPARMRIRAQYRIFPVCSERVSLQRGVSPIVSSDADIEVRC